MTVGVSPAAGGSVSTGSIEVAGWSSITGTLEAGTGYVKSGDDVLSIVTPSAWYVFSWWTTDCGETVTADCAFTWEFRAITYTVTWENSDGTTLETDTNVAYGTTPTYNRATPTSGGNAQYSYTFNGWTPATWGVTWDVTYTATYTQSVNKYLITFVDGNGNTIQTWMVAYWETPEYTWATPTKTATAQYTYTFIGWSPSVDSVTWAQVYTATYTSTVNQYTVTINVNNNAYGSISSGSISDYYGAIISVNENVLTISWVTVTATPTTNDAQYTYTFSGWTNNCGAELTWNCTIIANFERSTKESSSSGGWYSGWGGRSNSVISSDSEKSTEWETWSTVDSSAKPQNDTSTYSDEFQRAYEFAYKNWITTMDSIDKANMNWPLTRIAMAKMLSYYAINVLWQTPDETRINKFNDITDKLDADYDNGVTLAYQLWIMWINMPNNNFRPNDLVTRAEFATALSRMLYSTPDGKDKYYSTHLAKLMEEKIITNDTPNLQELRGYVMIMLMRSAK